MTIWRGLVRLWIVASVLWVAFMALVLGGQVVTPYIQTHYYSLRSFPPGAVRLSDWPGSAVVNSTAEVRFDPAVVVYVSPELSRANLDAWSPVFARERVALRATEVSASRWKALEFALLVSLIPPIGVAALGYAFRWVVLGFGWQPRA